MVSIIKPNYDDNRIKLSEAIPLKTPLSIQITPSSKCNFKCNYCIHSSGTMINKQLMEWDTFTRLCKQIKNFDEPLKQVTIAGWGEPLTNKKLPFMISYMKNMNITNKVSLVTNGSLLNRETSDALIQSGIDFIKISLQGMSAVKYKEICGVQIDFNSFVKNIQYLYENKKDCQVFIKIADISISEGEDSKFFSTFQNITDRMYIETIRPIFNVEYESIGVNIDKVISKYGEIHSPLNVCPQPFYMMNITPSGDVLPCCSYYDPSELGNIWSITLREIWEGEKMRDFWMMMLSKNRDQQNIYPVCNGCKIPDVVVLPGDELDADSDRILKKFKE